LTFIRDAVDADRVVTPSHVGDHRLRPDPSVVIASPIPPIIDDIGEIPIGS